MPKWKGKKVPRKRHFDLKWAAEFREYMKERRKVYVSKPAYEGLRAFIKMQEDN